jgi:ribA/ribD-fused uncharacterized protein
MSTGIFGLKGQYKFLSNFYPANVEFEGRTYFTVEHAYQAAKTFDEQARYVISRAEGPAKAKQLGMLLSNRRDDWSEARFEIMLTLVRSKFRDPKLEQKMIDTGELVIVEVNTWNDWYWGTCNGIGKNKLGEILMRVRAELRTARGMINTRKRMSYDDISNIESPGRVH